MGNNSVYKVIQNRDKLPQVILKRMFLIKDRAKVNTRIDKLEREIENIFRGTKVRIGQYSSSDERKNHLFVSNKKRGKADLLIERITS